MLSWFYIKHGKACADAVDVDVAQSLSCSLCLLRFEWVFFWCLPRIRSLCLCSVSECEWVGLSAFACWGTRVYVPHVMLLVLGQLSSRRYRVRLSSNLFSPFGSLRLSRCCTWPGRRRGRVAKLSFDWDLCKSNANRKALTAPWHLGLHCIAGENSDSNSNNNSWCYSSNNSSNNN